MESIGLSSKGRSQSLDDINRSPSLKKETVEDTKPLMRTDSASEFDTKLGSFTKSENSWGNFGLDMKTELEVEPVSMEANQEGDKKDVWCKVEVKEEIKVEVKDEPPTQEDYGSDKPATYDEFGKKGSSDSSCVLNIFH